MRKAFLVASVIFTSLTSFAMAGDFGNTGFGAAAGAFGASGSGTLTGSFAHNQQSGFGTGYAQTETTANAGSNLQAGTNVPFVANGFANTSSLSQSGSQVNNGNGSVSNSTGGFGLAGTALGGGFVAGLRR